MGHSVTTKGSFILNNGQELAAANAIVAELAKATYREVPEPVTYEWKHIWVQVEDMCYRNGVQVDGHFFAYSATRLNSWASIVFDAIAPFCSSESCISFVGEYGDEWRWVIEGGEIVTQIQDPKDGAWRPGSPWLM